MNNLFARIHNALQGFTAKVYTCCACSKGYQQQCSPRSKPRSQFNGECLLIRFMVSDLQKQVFDLPMRLPGCSRNIQAKRVLLRPGVVLVYKRRNAMISVAHNSRCRSMELVSSAMDGCMKLWDLRQACLQYTLQVRKIQFLVLPRCLQS